MRKHIKPILLLLLALFLFALVLAFHAQTDMQILPQGDYVICRVFPDDERAMLYVVTPKAGGTVYCAKAPSGTETPPDLFGSLLHDTSSYKLTVTLSGTWQFSPTASYEKNFDEK